MNWINTTIRLVKTACICLAICLSGLGRINAQQNAEIIQPHTLVSFEDELPPNITVSKGKISLSEKHRLTGKNCLRWNFEPYDTLTFSGEIGYKVQRNNRVVEILGVKYPQKDLPTCFRFPIYSEKNQDVMIRFAFGRDKIIDCYTDVLLDYKHWYYFSMAYDQGDLIGTPREDMDQLKFIIESDNPGTIFFDDLIISIKQRSNNIYPTYLELYQKNPDRTAYGEKDGMTNIPWFPLATSVSVAEEQSFQTIEDRLFDLEWGGRLPIEKLDDSEMQTFRDKYNSYNISRPEGSITGDQNTASYAYVGLLKEIGIKYAKLKNPDQKNELGTMAANMVEHAIDINDREISHYRGQGFADACYLIKDKLKATGQLEEAVAFLKRNYLFPKFYNEDVDKGINSDYLFTSSISSLLCVLLMDNSPERVRDMRHLVSYYNNVALQYATGLNETFKPDGSHYHHGNAYPDQYGYYTMPVVCKFVRLLSRTEFHLTQETHERMKENVKVRCFYKSQHFFPWAFAHLRVRPEQKAEVNDVLHIALAGTPDGQEPIDKEMAALYLRYMEGEKLPADAQKIIDAGITPAPIPQGNKTLSYFAKGLHRKNDWFISVGAYCKYIYQCEMWEGRPDGRGDIKTNIFFNWGQTEICYPDKPDSRYINNGWDLDGWDWTRFPGTTTIKAPMDRIRTHVTGSVEHLVSDQGFVGGLDFSDGNGVFVTKLHGDKKYKLDSFYATKTYFFFGDLMICLGTDIASELPEYMTQTTLFQNALKDEPFNLFINNLNPEKANYFEKSLNTASHWILDSRKIGYFIPKGQNLKISYSNQKSRDDHDKKDTEGVFETVWLEHGFAPENASYEYAVKVETDEKAMKSFAGKMNSPNGKVYNVLQADDRAHIVEFPESHTKAYVLFQKNYNLNSGVLKGISFPSIVMTKETSEKLNLAVCDPDLFHDGTESEPSSVRVFLNGNWKIDKILNRNGEIIQEENGITVIEFECQHGLTSEVLLSKIN